LLLPQAKPVSASKRKLIDDSDEEEEWVPLTTGVAGVCCERRRSAQHVNGVCVCPVWVPCVALPSGGGSSVGPSPLCGSHVWVPCVGPLCGSPLCGSPLCGSPVWLPCVGPSSRCVHGASTRVMSPARSHAPAQMEHSKKGPMP